MLVHLNVLPHPTKPNYGDKCNGCGICCMTGLCPIATSTFTDHTSKGPCPALEYEDNRFWCGMIRRPTFYMVGKSFPAIDRYIGAGVADNLIGPEEYGCDAILGTKDYIRLVNIAADQTDRRQPIAASMLEMMLENALRRMI